MNRYTPEQIEKMRAAAVDLYDALRDARIYVAMAYECAFPDQQQNEDVLAAVDAALSKVPNQTR